jgi:LemA protein
MIRFSPRVSALAAVVILTPAMAGCGINAIPTKEEAAKARWADVQSQYQRRADLVPNLVATVQGAAIAERTTLTQVIEARAQATGVTVTPETLNDPAAFQRYQAAQGQLSQALSRLLLVVERYPEIRSNQNFITLQSQLEGTENRIAIARRDYNEAVRDYNTSLRTFPTVIWANTIHSGSEPMQLFSATEAAQTAPDVNFDALSPAARPGGAAPAVTPGAAPPAVPAAQ